MPALRERQLSGLPGELVNRLRTTWVPSRLPEDAVLPDGPAADPVDQVGRLYGRLGLPRPAVFFAASPRQAWHIVGLVGDCDRALESSPGAIARLVCELAAEEHRPHLPEEALSAVLDWVLRTEGPCPALASSRLYCAGADPWLPYWRREPAVPLWWFHHRFAVVCAEPVVLRYDAGGRLHAEDGPALVWPNGDTIHAWHGTPVPEELLTGEDSVSRILSERNLEVRRCAIEMLGWPRFLDRSWITPIGRAVADPANPGHDLRLYYLPSGVLGFSATVLLCWNASVERDGTRRRYGILTPPELDDPLSAAAWTFGLTATQYGSLRAAS